MNKVIKKTIEDAIKEVLHNSPEGLSLNEITEKILSQNLYTFKAKEPQSVVNHTIRKSCVGIDLKISKDNDQKAFSVAGKGKYKLNIRK